MTGGRIEGGGGGTPHTFTSLSKSNETQTRYAAARCFGPGTLPGFSNVCGDDNFPDARRRSVENFPLVDSGHEGVEGDDLAPACRYRNTAEFNHLATVTLTCEPVKLFSNCHPYQ